MTSELVAENGYSVDGTTCLEVTLYLLWRGAVVNLRKKESNFGKMIIN